MAQAMNRLAARATNNVATTLGVTIYTGQ